MKLLLTSGGLCNESMVIALKGMLAKSFNEATLCFIPTASTGEAGNHDWFVSDLNRVYNLGWKSFDILELNSLPKDVVVKRLEEADVIYVEGGNTYHLAKSIVDNDLVDDFLRLLETKVYVGVSAGSMIFGKDLTDRMLAFYDRYDELYNLNNRQSLSPFNLFDWFFKPHVNFSTWEKRVMDFSYYAVDDQTALKIVDGRVEVISKGKWELVQ